MVEDTTQEVRPVVLVRYGEIHLKGLNRPYFERVLIERMGEALKDIPDAVVSKAQGRMFVRGYAPAAQQAVMDALSRVFGIIGLSPAMELPKELDAIGEWAVKLLQAAGTTQTSFKVEARRSDKRFPMDSMELAREIGGRILDGLPGMRVDVHEPLVRVGVEIREHAYVYVNAIPAAGGMPIGTNGRACLLLSGGIDSPVAGWMVAKRGVSLAAVHFESPPYTSQRAQDKVIELARLLRPWTGPIRLHIVPFTDIQRSLYEDAPDSQLTVLMRRYMMRIAERIAEKERCQALVTGESIGQVASQTIQSLSCTNAVVDMPVFRPLIGFDKQEIMDKARVIGTYETSILPYEDCCTVFTPRHPVTHPKREMLEESEAKFDTLAMVQAALDGVKCIEIE